MARGATNGEIAARLHVAPATVKTHVGSIFAKLDVRDRAAAIVLAFDHGVVSPGSTPTPASDWIGPTSSPTTVGREPGPVDRCAARRLRSSLTPCPIRQP